MYKCNTIEYETKDMTEQQATSNKHAMLRLRGGGAILLTRQDRLYEEGNQLQGSAHVLHAVSC